MSEVSRYIRERDQAHADTVDRARERTDSHRQAMAEAAARLGEYRQSLADMVMERSVVLVNELKSEGLSFPFRASFTTTKLVAQEPRWFDTIMGRSNRAPNRVSVTATKPLWMLAHSVTSREVGPFSSRDELGYDVYDHMGLCLDDRGTLWQFKKTGAGQAALDPSDYLPISTNPSVDVIASCLAGKLYTNVAPPDPEAVWEQTVRKSIDFNMRALGK